MNKKYNILFLSSWYPNKTSPQAGNFVQKHAEAVGVHHNIFVLHIAPRAQKEKFVIESKTVNNIHETIVYYRKVTNTLPGVSHLLKFLIRREAHLLGYAQILSIVKTIDLVHLNICYPAGLFALHLKKKYNIPYIISENWTALLDSDPITFNVIEQYFVNKINRNAALLCPVSNDLKKALQKIAPQQSFQIVPNVVDVNVFQYKPRTRNEMLQILHISTLKEEHKNMSGILRVIKELSALRNDFRLTIAGNGDINRLKQIASELNIVDKVVFEGEKNTLEVAQLMERSDLFLLFSNYENLPCVVVESLTMGLPVLSTDVGGVPEMLDKSNGILVKPKDEKNLLHQLNNMLNNIDQYQPKEISNNAIKKYSYENVGHQFSEIYTQIINN